MLNNYVKYILIPWSCYIVLRPETCACGDCGDLGDRAMKFDGVKGVTRTWPVGPTLNQCKTRRPKHLGRFPSKVSDVSLTGKRNAFCWIKSRKKKRQNLVQCQYNGKNIWHDVAWHEWTWSKLLAANHFAGTSVSLVMTHMTLCCCTSVYDFHRIVLSCLPPNQARMICHRPSFKALNFWEPNTNSSCVFKQLCSFSATP